MITRLVLATAAAALVATPALASPIEIRADVTRDGRMDRLPAPRALPAVVLPNLDDDARRCPRVRETPRGALRAEGRTITARAVIACNDASDQVSNGPADVADLTPVRVMPSRAADDSVPVGVEVRGAPTGALRVLVRRPEGTYRSVQSQPITASDLRRGVMLGVEATDVRRDRSRWDGRASLRVVHGADRSPWVPLQVAPMIYQTDLGRVTRLFVGGTTPPPIAVPGSAEMIAVSRRYVRTAARAAADATGASTTVLRSPPGDVWVQDAFETASVTRPTPGGAHGMYLLLRPPASDRPGRNGAPALAGSELSLYNQARGRDVGVVSTLPSPGEARGGRGYSSGGNWSVVPPYRTGTARYPHGRIIYGGTPDPRLVRMARAQNQQPPLAVDVSWLGVGHIDETVMFLPAPNDRGWVVAIPDPRAGRALLQQAATQAGPQTTVMTGVTRSDTEAAPVSIQRTVAAVLADGDVTRGTALAGDKTDRIVSGLTRTLSLSDDEIVRLPVLMRLSPEGKVVAELPNVTNSQYLGRGVLLAPQQHGPMVNGVDLFQQEIARRLAPHGVTPRWIDDVQHAHLAGGEVHCTTNVLRERVGSAARWWEAPAPSRR